MTSSAVLTFYFVVPFIKMCTFYYHGINTWNEIPKDDKIIKSKNVFKTSAKKLLLDKEISRHNSDFFYFTKKVCPFTHCI